MADNIQLNLGSGGDELSAHDLGSSVKLQRVISAGVESTNNSTQTPLASAATYTGTWEQNMYPDVMVSCHCDNPGTLFFDFSPDGVVNNSFPVAGFDVASGIHEFHLAVKGPRYFRVRLVNETGAQTYLRLYTYYGQFRPGNLPVNSAISADSDAIVVRSVNSATDLAFGKFGGMSEGEKFGSVRLLDAVDCPVDVWAYGSDDAESGADKTFPTSAQDLFICSDSASDTDVDVTIEYIDSNGELQELELNTNGQTPLDFGDNGFDVNRAYESGATAAVGNIYISTANDHTAGVPNDPEDVLAFIGAGFGQTQLATYTVPLGKQLRIRKLAFSLARSSGSAGSAVAHLKAREFGKTWIVKRVIDATTAKDFDREVAGLIFPARTSLKMTVDSVSDTDTNCNASWIFELVDE